MPEFIDTHTHIYLPEFDEDRKEIIKNAIDSGVSRMLLPNVDVETIDPMMEVCNMYPDNCFPMIGLHPTSVKEDYKEVLEKLLPMISGTQVCGIGEIGMDLYWDTTYEQEQREALSIQLQWSLDSGLPVAIHARNSLDQLQEVFEDFRGRGLKGVMHCFPGNQEQADWFVDFGFHLGIGGVVTFKKSKMARVVKNVPLSKIILETDAPYLAPSPYRGKRNQPAYIPVIAEKIAEIKGIDLQEVTKVTTDNAMKLFYILR